MTVTEVSEIMDGWEDMNGVLNIEGSISCNYSRTCRGAGGNCLPKSQKFEQNQNFLGSDSKNLGKIKF